MIHFLSDYISPNNFIVLLVGIEFSFSLFFSPNVIKYIFFFYFEKGVTSDFH